MPRPPTVRSSSGVQRRRLRLKRRRQARRNRQRRSSRGRRQRRRQHQGRHAVFRTTRQTHQRCCAVSSKPRGTRCQKTTRICEKRSSAWDPLCRFLPKSQGSTARVCRRSPIKAMVVIFALMMVKFATINTTSFGPLAELLEAEDCILEDAAHIICVQEHHLAQDKLPGFQARMKQAGYHGV